MPGLRAHGRLVGTLRHAVDALEQLGQAEVGQLGVAVLRDEDVVRLDVAVDDARSVRGGQAVGDADQEFDDLPPCVTRRIRPRLERAAVDELRDEIRTSIERRRRRGP